MTCIMSTAIRFKGRDILFPKWLTDWGFIDSKETGGAATAIRSLPNKRLLIMRVYPKNVFQRPEGVERFELELSDHEGCGRARLGGGGMPHVMSRMIALAIRDNQVDDTHSEVRIHRFGVLRSNNGIASKDAGLQRGQRSRDGRGNREAGGRATLSRSLGSYSTRNFGVRELLRSRYFNS